MKFQLIFPKWNKLQGQTTFNLPPHGATVFAATIPSDVEVEFIDENLEEMRYDDSVDFVGISMLLTTQVKRGWAIADEYRNDPVAVSECWAGAITKEEYLNVLNQAGFKSIDIIEESMPYEKGKTQVVSFTIRGKKTTSCCIK